LIRKVGSVPFTATALVALALLAGTGCSEDPGPTGSEVDQAFSKEELAEMRKSVKTIDEFRELKRVRLAERTSGGAVTTKTVPGNTKPK
jgi:hypothetical protein